MRFYVKKDNKKIYAEKTDPDIKFSVFTFEEQDFACTFTKKQIEEKSLEVGSNTITTFANFNFETLAYLKVYFIDKQRQRAMVREGIDIFEEFNIKDKNPIAVYTNGPAALEIGTTTPLIGVSPGTKVLPKLSLGLKNREGWKGKIRQLKELVIFTPKGVTLDITSCNKNFNDYSIDDCSKSCKDLVHDECTKVCNEGYEPRTSPHLDCISSCDQNLVKCGDECTFLFQDQGEYYTAYSLNLKNLKIRDEFKDFEKYKFFSCNFNSDNVLENTPITTKFFRVKARYDYTVEQPITIIIDKVPEITDKPETGNNKEEDINENTKQTD